MAKQTAPAKENLTANVPAVAAPVPALQASSKGLLNVPPVNVENFPIMTMPAEDVKQMLDMYIGAGGISAFDLPRLTVPTGGATKWKVETLQGTTEVETVNAIILYWRPTRGMWEKEYGKAPPGPPQCKSDDGIMGKGAPGGLCQKCPLKDFAANGDKPKCKEKFMLFLMPEGERVPWVLFAPTMSIKNIQKYFLRLMSSGTGTYAQVVTALSLKEERNTGGILYSEIQPLVQSQIAKDQMESLKNYIAGMRPIFEKFVPRDEDLREGHSGPDVVG